MAAGWNATSWRPFGDTGVPPVRASHVRARRPCQVTRALCTIVLICSAAGASAAERVELVVDCAQRLGAVRPLHGVNNGPLEDGGLLDLSEFHRALAIPLTRLHDIHWPNPDVVDFHVVFPNAGADPAEPQSYDFGSTDEYLRATLATGTKLIYRLGESIEHRPTKRHVHPPRDVERWAAACEGIVRHYNEGWADGARHDIRYWEIWNEPDNRPAMWTGTDEDYFRLYAATAKRIKGRWPGLKVGGPAVGNTGDLVDGVLRPAPFVVAFLDRCRRDALPLDFFSWHVYATDPRDVAARAHAVRKLLDDSGFRATESHLNEWNYLPDNDWTPVTRAGQGEPRRRFYARQGGAEGAAFVAATLLRLQDAPLDAANFFNGGNNGFGLFDPHGVPKKNYFAFKAFKMLLETPARVEVTGEGAVACAGLGGENDALTLIVSVESGEARRVGISIKNIPWPGRSTADVWLLDADQNLARVDSSELPPENPRIERTLVPHSVCVIRLRASDASDPK